MDPWAWEPLLISVVQVLFVVALIPTLRDKNAAVPARTSALTAIGLFAITVAMLGLGEPLAALTSFASSTAWFFILVKRPVRRR